MNENATARRAYLHIGAPKTGSTFLQGVLWNNRAALLEHGVHMLGDDQGQHYRAGKDLRGIPFDPDDPGRDWAGAWDRMVDRSDSSASEVVVLSDEHLAALGPGRIERAVDSLSSREVHVIYAVRDLPGLLPSEWQENVKHGSTLTYDEWVRRVLDVPDEWPGRWFWAVHDPRSVVGRWSQSVAPERIHVLLMPPRDAPRDELWRRFAGVMGLDPAAATDLSAAANPSLGLAAAEVLRQVNLRVPDALPRWHRTGILRDVLANKILNPLGEQSRPTLPGDVAARVRAEAQSIVAALPTIGCDVIGDVTPPELGPVGDAKVASADVLDVALDALTGAVVQMAEMRDRQRAAQHELRAQHHVDLQAAESRHQQALADQEADLWRRHPAAHRIHRAKQGVVAAGDRSRAVEVALDAYRRLRGRSLDPDRGADDR